MEQAEAVEPDAVVDLAQQDLVDLCVGDVDSRDVEVARVEADAEPFVPSERLEQQHELVHRAADRAAGSGRVLHQEPSALVAAVEDLLQCGHDSFQAGLEAGAQVGTDMEDDSVGADRARRVHGRGHRVDALLVDGVVGRREVDQVEAVHEGGQTGFLTSRAKALKILGVVSGEPPRARALHEELHGVCIHPDRVVERLLDSPRTVRAEQH
jgi:hypothetical protein